MMSELKSGNNMMSGVNDDVHVQNGHIQNLHPFSTVNDRLFSDDESTFVNSENDRLFSDDESTTIGGNQMTRAITDASQQVTTCPELNNTMTSGMNNYFHVQNGHSASSRSERLFSDDESTTLDSASMPPNGQVEHYQMLSRQDSSSLEKKSNFCHGTNFLCEHAKRFESTLATPIPHPGEELAATTLFVGHLKLNHPSQRKRRRIPDVIVIPNNMMCSHHQTNSNFPHRTPDETGRIFQRRKTWYSEAIPDITRSSCNVICSPQHVTDSEGKLWHHQRILPPVPIDHHARGALRQQDLPTPTRGPTVDCRASTSCRYIIRSSDKILPPFGPYCSQGRKTFPKPHQGYYC